ncbi:hypothetical protein AR685_06145 [Chryseobacterium sp. JAH]|nr:hypothetical protein AR685_06145 [Chryseobacterium sp. JAH]
MFAQDKTFSDLEIKQKLDSVKTEGNLLFTLENAAWHSSDLLRENNKVQNIAGQYLTYKTNDSVKAVFLNKAQNKIVAEYVFKNDNKKPIKTNLNERNLNGLEIDLKNVRSKIIEQLADPKYEVGSYDGFNLNVIIIPADQVKFKTYLISGTSSNGVIPFGNDYLFISDKNGVILEHHKFHSRLIPTQNPPGGGTITMATHSHLRTNPFISATDICTFRLYAPFFPGLKEFSVYSPALSKYMIYNLEKNAITTEKNIN